MKKLFKQLTPETRVFQAHHDARSEGQLKRKLGLGEVLVESMRCKDVWGESAGQQTKRRQQELS